ADSATHNHEIDEENLDDGFDNEPDCRPFFGKYIFDVDIKSQRIRLLREVIHRDFKPFEHTGIQYTQHVTMPITELATLRPQWGVPNKYLISEDPHDPGKKYVQIIWLRKTAIKIDTKGQGHLSDAVLSTPINLTNIDFDEMPDCIIEGDFPGERFYLDVNQNGDIRFLKVR
ncbi:hypothetical protein KY326_01190, partial [Candidatus Woesearchaeota archaeon]|nr:hypothetical protein [Candidatus Woesearchaeota archaeon]